MNRKKHYSGNLLALGLVLSTSGGAHSKDLSAQQIRDLKNMTKLSAKDVAAPTSTCAKSFLKTKKS